MSSTTLMLTLWLITDNKPGHRSQLQGLSLIHI